MVEFLSWPPAPPSSSHPKRFDSAGTPQTALACIAFGAAASMQGEPTNISIEAGSRPPRSSSSSSNERLTPSLARAAIAGTPARDFPGPSNPNEHTSHKGDASPQGGAGKKNKVVSPEACTFDPVRAKATSRIPGSEPPSVDSITVPVMRLSIGDDDDDAPLRHEPPDSADPDPDPLTEASFREAYSTAEAVASFLDQQLQAQRDEASACSSSIGGNPPPAGPGGRRPGRMFQRRNSFVIHNRKRSRSLEGGRDAGAGAGAGWSSAGIRDDEESASAAAAVAAAEKPRFDTRSQSEGVLMMGPSTTTVAHHHGSPPPLGLHHRLSLPWKRTKKGDSDSRAGPAASSSKHS